MLTLFSTAAAVFLAIGIAWAYFAIRPCEQDDGRRVNASLCYSDFLRGNRFSRLATCCGSRGNAKNVIARLGTDTIN